MKFKIDRLMRESFCEIPLICFVDKTNSDILTMYNKKIIKILRNLHKMIYNYLQE